MTVTQIADRPTSSATMPPLCNGDHLSLSEFERRWDLHPEIKKAELIDGVVFLEMTVYEFHASAHAAVMVWLGLYWAPRTASVRPLDNITVRLLGTQNLQPDAILRYLKGTSIVEGSILHGPPELVVEVSSSSAAYDLGRKKEIYREAGVAEYVVWQEFENRIDWYVLESGEYNLLTADAAGIIESRVFPGLRLPVQAMLDQDIATVVAAVHSRLSFG